jgi:chromosome segregation ATPase
MTPIEIQLHNVAQNVANELQQLRATISLKDREIASLEDRLLAAARATGELISEKMNRAKEARSLSDLEIQIRLLESEKTELEYQLRTQAPSHPDQQLIDELVAENAELKSKLAMYARDNEAKAARITSLASLLESSGV